MKVSDAIAEILRREGIEIVVGYPVNHILERGAAAGIRPIIVRQERIGLHMADAMSRVTSGRKLGVFVMQHGPGTENAYGGVAQAWSESVPILVMPGGYARQKAWIDRNYNASVQMRGITKSAALEFGTRRVRVNSIHPGAIETPMVASAHVNATFWAGQCIPRIGQPAEVSAIVVFLASDESSYCTGQEFVVDGGSVLGQALPGVTP